MEAEHLAVNEVRRTAVVGHLLHRLRHRQRQLVDIFQRCHTANSATVDSFSGSRTSAAGGRLRRPGGDELLRGRRSPKGGLGREPALLTRLPPTIASRPSGYRTHALCVPS